MYDALGQGFTVIGHFRHVVGAAIPFLDECWSGAERDDFFDLRYHVLAEGSQCFAIGEFLFRSNA